MMVFSRYTAVSNRVLILLNQIFEAFDATRDRHDRSLEIVGNAANQLTQRSQAFLLHQHFMIAAQ